uniref:SAM domain-containing protein n=1 Tax=Varanus komodoensis TaxID=61221 RepID=A0A8D2J211_VARKO
GGARAARTSPRAATAAAAAASSSSSEAPRYQEWILDTIDSLRSRKARPDLERICRMVRRRHGPEPERTRAELEKLIQQRAVLRVSYKGSISYRNAARVQPPRRGGAPAASPAAPQRPAPPRAEPRPPPPPAQEESSPVSLREIVRYLGGDGAAPGGGRVTRGRAQGLLQEERLEKTRLGGGGGGGGNSVALPRAERGAQARAPNARAYRNKVRGRRGAGEEVKGEEEEEEEEEEEDEVSTMSEGSEVAQDYEASNYSRPGLGQVNGDCKDSKHGGKEVGSVPSLFGSMHTHFICKCGEVYLSPYEARGQEMPVDLNPLLLSPPSSLKEKHSDPVEWTVSDVVDYFTEAGFAEQATAFQEQEIDGKSLLLMQRTDVLTGLSIRLGPALKIYEYHIKVLQQCHFEEDEGDSFMG